MLTSGSRPDGRPTAADRTAAERTAAERTAARLTRQARSQSVREAFFHAPHWCCAAWRGCSSASRRWALAASATTARTVWLTAKPAWSPDPTGRTGRATTRAACMPWTPGTAPVGRTGPTTAGTTRARRVRSTAHGGSHVSTTPAGHATKRARSDRICHIHGGSSLTVGRRVRRAGLRRAGGSVVLDDLVVGAAGAGSRGLGGWTVEPD